MKENVNRGFCFERSVYYDIFNILIEFQYLCCFFFFYIMIIIHVLLMFGLFFPPLSLFLMIVHTQLESGDDSVFHASVDTQSKHATGGVHSGNGISRKR